MRPAAVRAASVADEWAKLDTAYAGDLEQLAAWCDQHQLAAEARQTRAWHVERDPRKLYVFVLPDSLAAPTKQRKTQIGPNGGSGSLSCGALKPMPFTLWPARPSKRIGSRWPTSGFARQSASGPTTSSARAVLGYEKHDGRWVTPYAARRLASGQVFDDRYGWLPAADVARYERGERNYRGTWLNAEKDASLHVPIKNGWRIETEHYVVTTNHSLEAGVRLANKLERLNDIWRHDLRHLLHVRRRAGEALSRRRLAATREQASGRPVSEPGRIQCGPQTGSAHDRRDARVLLVRESHGIFLCRRGRGRCDALARSNASVVSRESRVVRDLGSKSNFWVVEAVALYMESLESHDGYSTLGGANEGRVPIALTRLLKDDFYVPLGEVTSFGRDTLQHHPRLATLYTEFAGLANFFMHYGGDRYRQPLIDYLIAVYSGRADPDTLAKLTGASYDKLDQQYREYMNDLAGRK